MSPLRRAVVPSFTALLATAAATSGQVPLMIPDSGPGDRVMLFDGFSGALIDQNWITDLGGAFVFSTPKEAMVINNEIWVSDQVADAIHRFKLDDRGYIGSITTDHTGAGLDNLRGMGFDGTNVYLSTAADGIILINPATATATGALPITGSLFDAQPFGANELLVTSSTTDDVQRHDRVSGAFINNFANDLDFPQQVAQMGDGSIISLSTIGANGIEGVYHYNADGTLRRFIDTQLIKNTFGEQVPTGAWELGDGNYLVSTGIGIFKYDVAGNSFSQVLGGVSGQYINPFVPEPASLGLVTAAGVLALRRQRRSRPRNDL